MKLKTTLLAALLTVFAASTVTAWAAEGAMMEKTDASKPATGEKKKTTKKKVKKHSHAEEKSGMPMPEAGGKSHQETMDKDMPMHDHTKDRH